MPLCENICQPISELPLGWREGLNSIEIGKFFTAKFARLLKVKKDKELQQPKCTGYGTLHDMLHFYSARTFISRSLSWSR